MVTLQPTVLEDIDLESFLRHLLDTHGSTSTLVVCSSKEGFLNQLQAAVADSTKDQQPEQPSNDHPVGKDGAETTGETPLAVPVSQPHGWTIPTLRLLASAQTLQLAFCEDVTHLRAYLAAYPYQHHTVDDSTVEPPRPAPNPRILALLNPIALHRETSNFSAQGLNRTFSIAVDAAHTSGSKLVVTESRGSASYQHAGDQLAMHVEPQNMAPVNDDRGIWDEEVSILSVATKTFGAGERGWVGRTVKLRTIAGRWCVFERWAKDGG